jgi:hypothetical protein
MNRHRVPGRRAHVTSSGVTLTLALAVAPLACVLGPAEAPGCRSDVECDPGFSCRAGTCFRVTTPLSTPRDPGDAGVGGG